MALAFEKINGDIIRKLKWRSSPKNETTWLTKMPYTRLVSFAVPKNDKDNTTRLRNLRSKNILQGGYLYDTGTSTVANLGGTSPAYTYGNNSYRTDDTDSVHKFITEDEIKRPQSRNYVPNPGIVSLSTTNKGSFGSLRGLNFQIKCYDLAQLETLEVLFMTPGISVLAEWGWSYMGNTPTLLSNVGDENAFSDKDELQKKITGLVRDSKGDYDACIATIAGWNWSIDKDGSYNVQVDATSRGDTMLSLPINRANSVFVDYVGRLSYDPGVKTRSKDLLKRINAGDIDTTDAGVIDQVATDVRAGNKKRINLLRIPVFKYDFGQTKINEAREEARKAKEEAEEDLEESGQEQDRAQLEREVAQNAWYITVKDEMANTRMAELYIGTDKSPDQWKNTIPMKDLSLNNAFTNDNKSIIGSRLTDYFQLMQNFNLNSFKNMGAWGLAYYTAGSGNKEFFKGVGFGMYYNWVHGNRSTELPDTRTARAELFDKKEINNNVGIRGKDSQGNWKLYRPAFISRMYFDGAKCPIKPSVDGMDLNTNIYGRPHRITVNAGNGTYKNSPVNNSKIHADSSIASLKKFLKNNKPTREWAEQFNALFDVTDEVRFEDMLKKPFKAMNGRGSWQLNEQPGDENENPAEVDWDTEVDSTIWSTPELTPQEGEDALPQHQLDSNFWYQKNKFNNLSEVVNVTAPQPVGITVYDHNHLKTVSTGLMEMPIRPKHWWMLDLPRLPILSISVGYGNDGTKNTIYVKNDSDSTSDRIPAKELSTLNGAKYYSTYTWYAFVDMQEWDPQAGEFKFMQELPRKSTELGTILNQKMKAAIDKQETSEQRIQDLEDRINNLAKTTGEYIPLWALEHLFNNTLNYNVGGKRLFRYDSGFLKYDKEKGDPVPDDITDIEDKKAILKEYAILFDVIDDGIETTEPGETRPAFSPSGALVFAKFFNLSGNPAVNDLNHLNVKVWNPIRSLPVKIANHPKLKSTNPLVCLLPGQENIIPNSEAFATAPDPVRDQNRDGEYSADDLLELIYDENLKINNLPDPDLFIGTCPIRGNIDEETLLDTGEDDGEHLINHALIRPNAFREISTSGRSRDKEMRSGYLGNILVHTDVIKSHIGLSKLDSDGADGEDGYRQKMEFATYYQRILGEISAACGNYWEFGLQIDSKTDNICRVVDTKYTKDITETSDTIWRFPLYGSDTAEGRTNHILRDFAIQSNIPNSMKAMAMYGTNASFLQQNTTEGNDLKSLQILQNIDWADVSTENVVYDNEHYYWNQKTGQMEKMENVKGSGISDFDGNILTVDEVTTKGDIFGVADATITDLESSLSTEAAAKAEEKKVPATYEDQNFEFHKALKIIHDQGPKHEGSTWSRFAEKCLYSMLNHPLPVTNAELDGILNRVESEAGEDKWTREAYIKKISADKLEENNPNFMSNLIPLDCQVTLDGISGIYFGNSFTLAGLPDRYNKKTAFQVKNVSHTIDTNGWQTTITGQMRTISEAAARQIRDFTDITG